MDVFEAALHGRVPENTVLSHDLLEGIFAGSGLVSDIEVVEEFPSRYDVAAARQHRWARGDWQLLPWIFGHGRDSSGKPGHRKIPLTGRWKMMDNLRRSLSAPAAFLALLGGWTLPFASAAVWSGFVLATIALPPLLPFFAGIVPRRRQISKRSHLRAVGKGFVPRSLTDWLSHFAPRASGMVDDRRHRANTLSTLHKSSAHAGVGHCGASEVRPSPHAASRRRPRGCFPKRSTPRRSSGSTFRPGTTWPAVGLLGRWSAWQRSADGLYERQHWILTVRASTRGSSHCSCLRSRSRSGCT